MIGTLLNLVRESNRNSMLLLPSVIISLNVNNYIHPVMGQLK